MVLSSQIKIMFPVSFLYIFSLSIVKLSSFNSTENNLNNCHNYPIL